MTNKQNKALVNTLHHFTESFIQGIDEYSLIKKLQSEPFNLFDANALTDSLSLFQTHFILFNGLYQLQQQWRREKKGGLHIHATNIQLYPYAQQNAAMGLHDPIAAYYLNWDNFSETNEKDVEVLLDSFWKRMARSKTADEGEISKAKGVLNITDDELLTKPLIKQKYRRLQHQYHPDKGGDGERSKSVMWAYQLLLTVIDK